MSTPTYSTVVSANMELTPCRVKFNSVDLGGTLSNVVIAVKYMKSPLHADQHGQTVIDRVNSGQEATITTELAEFRNKDLWAVVFPNMTYAGSAPHKYLDFKSKIGIRDSALAQKLELFPLSADSTNNDVAHTFPKAISTEESSFEFSPTGQSKLKIVWFALPDGDAAPFNLYRFGDFSL